MKANELTSRDLMVGDWLMHANGTLMQVKRIVFGHFACGEKYTNFWEYNNKFEPIPLTSEILEANNFQKDPDYIETYCRPDCSKFCFVKECDDWYFAICYQGGHICIAKCNYVHKFQHILNDLLGMDTEVVVKKIG